MATRERGRKGKAINPPPQQGIYEWHRGDYTASTDPTRLDLDVIHGFLIGEAYWSRGISRDLVGKSIRGSLAIGLYDPKERQVGFARVITDWTLFAYMRDVFVLPAHRGKGLGLWLAQLAIAHPDLADVRRWMLSTNDARRLYAKVGFQPLSHAETYMELPRAPSS